MFSEKIDTPFGKALIVILISFALALSAWVWQDRLMGGENTAPYFSCAKNLKFGGNFMYHVGESLAFRSMSVSQQYAHRFQAHLPESLSLYPTNHIGYAYIIWIATHLFPFLTDLKAIILFQAIFHLLICLGILFTTKLDPRFRWAFLVLYALNPLVLRVTVYNFYYFWQVIPSVALTCYLLKLYRHPLLWGSLFVLPFAFFTRSSIVLLIPFVFYWLYRHHSKTFLLAYIGFWALVALVFYKPTQKHIWHTVYIGIGAYQNSYNVSLDDSSGYRLYEKAFAIDTFDSRPGSIYFKTEVIDNYARVAQKAYAAIAKDNPLLILKNAIANTLQGFGVGYLNTAPDWLNYLLALFGLAVLLLLVKHKQWLCIALILASNITYIFYTPPIPVYLFGTYLLTVVSVLRVFFPMKQHQAATEN